MVAVMSKAWMRENKNKVQQEFADLVNKEENTLTTIASGEFKQSGTSVATVLVIIKKP